MDYGQQPLIKDRYTGMKGAFGYMLGLGAQFTLQFLVILVALAVYASLGRGIDTDAVTGDIAVNYAAMAATQAGFIAVFFLVSRGVNIREAAGLKRPEKKDGLAVLAAALFCLVSIYMMSSPAFLFDKLIQAIGYKPSGLGISFDSAGSIIAGIAVICILAPVGEELLFRGLVFGGLRSLFGEKRAIVFSALAFMLMHANPEQTVYQFLLGLILAGLMAVTGKIWVPMLLHALNNSLSLVIELWNGVMFIPDFYSTMHWLPATSIYLGITVLGAGAAFGLFYLLVKTYKKKQTQGAVAVAEKPEELPLSSVSDRSAKLIFFAACGIGAVLWLFTFVTKTL